MMTAVELHKRCNKRSKILKHPDAGVSCTCAHPGLVDTPLARYYFENDYLFPCLRPVLRPVLRAIFPIVLLKPSLCVDTMDTAMFGHVEKVSGKCVSYGRLGDVWGDAKSAEARNMLWSQSLALANMQDPI
jgi:hypothetical protein